MNENDKQKAAAIIERLYTRTNEGSVTWEESSDKNSYHTTIGDYTVQLIQDYDPESEDTYVKVQIRRFDGTLIDEIYPGYIFDIKFRPDPTIPHWKVLDTLYESARRYALGVDKAYDDILSQL